MRSNVHFRVKENIIERKKLVEELNRIWEKQLDLRKANGTSLHLEDEAASEILAKILYKSNQEKQGQLRNMKLQDIFSKDIIYYQRPLKSQIKSIALCKFECEHGIQKRVIPQSHPLFQEFRILDLINNLRIYNKALQDCSSQFITNEKRDELIILFNKQEIIKSKKILEVLIPKEFRDDYTLSHDVGSDKEFIGNKTLIRIKKALKGDPREKEIVNDTKAMESIWHLLYSVDTNEAIVRALIRPKNDFKLDESTAEKLSKIIFESKYGSLSAKALRKLLPLMRSGKLWSVEGIEAVNGLRILMDKLIDGEIDDSILNKTRKFIEAHGIKDIYGFTALPYWLAASIVYQDHSNVGEIKMFLSPDEIKPIINNDLRNPIVQQILNEAMQVVADIWKTYGKPDEIRIELSRDLKNSSAERQKITERQNENKKINSAIKNKLVELKRGDTDLERYKLWMEAFDQNGIVPKDAAEYRKHLMDTIKVSGAELEKYKLWEEQKHISPYTGRPIPLSRLFNGNEYQVDHIIPKQRFFDDSLSNKVVVEANVNADKGKSGRNLMAMEYIELGSTDSQIKLLNTDSYIELVDRTYRGAKKKKLLSKEIPQDFVISQLKNSQYISVAIRKQLERIVGKENVHTTTGGITDLLREQWGIAHLFKELLLPRYEALEAKLAQKGKPEKIIDYVFDQQRQKHILKLKDYSKRLDHRHHAADALVIACTKPIHIQRLNNLGQIYSSKELKDRQVFENPKVRKHGGAWHFPEPWKGFVADAKENLEGCIVSVKNRKRLVTKGRNYYKMLVDGKPTQAKQKNGKLLSVRVQLHDQLPFGQSKELMKTKLKECLDLLKRMRAPKLQWKDDQIKSCFVNKQDFDLSVKLMDDFNNDPAKVIKHLQKTGQSPELLEREFTLVIPRYEKRIALNTLTAPQVKDIIDPVIREQVIKHLQPFGGIEKDALKKAFSGENIAKFNKDRTVPVGKVRVYQDRNMILGESAKFQLNRKNSLNDKLFIETGGNYAFAIYENQSDLDASVWPARRETAVISNFDAIQKVINGDEIFPEVTGSRKFILRANDVIYMPLVEQKPNFVDWDNSKEICSRLFIMTQATGNIVYFAPISVAAMSMPKFEFGTQDALYMLEGKPMKDSCIPMKVDRIGNLVPLFNYD